MPSTDADASTSCSIALGIFRIGVIQRRKAGTGAHLLLIGFCPKVFSVCRVFNEARQTCAQARIFLLAGYKASLQPKTRVDSEKQGINISG